MSDGLDDMAVGEGSIVRRKPDGSFECVPDEVTVEEPLEIRLGGASLAITMRTPGHDEELTAGFLLAEGLIRDKADVQNIEPAAADSLGNIVEVTLSPNAATPKLE